MLALKHGRDSPTFVPPSDSHTDFSPYSDPLITSAFVSADLLTITSCLDCCALYSHSDGWLQRDTHCID